MWTSGDLCTLDLCVNDGAGTGVVVGTDGADVSSTSDASADTVGSEDPVVDNTVVVAVVGDQRKIPLNLFTIDYRNERRFLESMVKMVQWDFSLIKGITRGHGTVCDYGKMSLQ